jgi:sarcosine oxidase
VARDWDCAVVGLGAMGSATLWQLAERGARVIGVDRFAPPHDRGSSHGESRVIRSAYFEDPSFLPLVRRAFSLWRTLEADSGEALLAMTGAAMIGRAGSAVIEGALRTAQVHALEHELLDAEEASRRLPQHRLGAGDVVLVERDGGVLAPERCVAAMLRRAQELGAQVTTACAVQGIEPRDDGGCIRLHLDGGAIIDARRVVVCAGPWTPSLLPALRVPLWVERQVNAWFPVRDSARFAPQVFPVFLRQLDSGRLVYGVPSMDGATVKLAVHHEGARVDPDSVPRDVTAADLQPLQEYIADRLHGVETRPVRAITCLYTNTPDERFLIEAVPDVPGVTVVSACSGHGFKFAPAVGETAAGLALGTSPG